MVEINRALAEPNLWEYHIVGLVTGKRFVVEDDQTSKPDASVSINIGGAVSPLVHSRRKIHLRSKCRKFIIRFAVEVHPEDTRKP